MNTTVVVAAHDRVREWSTMYRNYECWPRVGPVTFVSWWWWRRLMGIPSRLCLGLIDARPTRLIPSPSMMPRKPSVEYFCRFQPSTFTFQPSGQAVVTGACLPPPAPPVLASIFIERRALVDLNRFCYIWAHLLALSATRKINAHDYISVRP